ncbi:hypothetical protein GA0115246_1160219, partial [Streptomyces sp. SolWspMP-sol7th]
PHVLDYQRAFADPEALGPRVAIRSAGAGSAWISRTC